MTSPSPNGEAGAGRRAGEDHGGWDAVCDKPAAVLVVEPDSAFRAYAQERLGAAGFTVCAVAGAGEALRCLGEGHFDLVLSVLDMPDGAGLALLRTLREGASSANLPVIVVVHRDEIAAVDAAFAAGATAFVSRPFHWAALAHQIRFVLRAAAQAEALRAARDKAVQADRFKANMLRLLQHELRTPLSLIVGFSEEIHRAPGNRNAADYARQVVESGRQLNTQFNALFTSALVLAGDVRWDFEPTKCQALIDKVQLGEEDLAAAKRVIVRYVMDCPGAVIQADLRHLTMAVRHLVRNAIIHGGDSERVDVVATATQAADGDRVVIAVRDQGPGLDAEALARCLEPFAQGGDPLTRKETGFGLGLAFAQRVVEAHGGVLRIVSPQEGGLIVTASLPALLPASQTFGQMRLA